MLGAYAVGKTRMVRRYVESIFDEKYLITLGVKIDKIRVALDDREVQLILGTSREPRIAFRCLLPTSREPRATSWSSTGRAATPWKWLSIWSTRSGKISVRFPLWSFSTRQTWFEEWEVSDQMLEPLREFQCPILKSSAKTGTGVKETFEALTRRLVQGLEPGPSS